MSGQREGWKALEGVKVWDLSMLLPGPFATQILADLGAEVLKVEAPGGDPARYMPMEMFRMSNRNKSSLSIDLKAAGADSLVESLARWADIFVEGFRPGVVERLGVSHERLSAINPRIIYCSISGYGQSGPWRDVPGHDLNYLAAGGAMSLCGHWLEPEPRRSGLPVADIGGSTFAAISILSALLKREKTGRGCYIDVSLSDAALAFTALRRGLDTDEPGRRYLFPTNDLFRAADGRHISLGMVEEHFWQKFRKLFSDEAPVLLDPRFDDEPSRRANGDELSGLIAALIATRGSGDWVSFLSQHDIPVQLAFTPREAATSEQVRHRNLVHQLDGESHIPFPVLVDGVPAGAALRPAPSVGEDGREFLTGLGIDETNLAKLISEGVVRLS